MFKVCAHHPCCLLRMYINVRTTATPHFESQMRALLQHACGFLFHG